MNNTSPKIILTGMIVLIVAAPIAVGSVYIVTYSAMELLIFSLLLLHLWTTDFAVGQKTRDILPVFWPARSIEQGATYLRGTLLLMLPLFLFLMFCLFQMIPLPISFLQKLSPGAAALYARLGLHAPSSMLHAPSSMLPLHAPTSMLPLHAPTSMLYAPSSMLYAPSSMLPLHAPTSMLHAPCSLLPLTLSLSATSTALLKWMAYASVFFLAATFPPHRSLLPLIVALFVIGFAEAVYGLYGYLNQSDYLLWFRKKYDMSSVTGTYINRNHFAGLMSLCIPVSLGLFASRISSRAGHYGALSLYFLFMGLVIMVLGLIFSMSRMGQFSLIVGMVFVGGLYIASIIKRGRRRSSTLVIASLLVLCLAGLWGMWKGLGPVEERWSTIEASYADRSLFWQSTMKLVRNFPLAGTGLGTYVLAYPPYKPDKLGAVIVDHAHNDYLEFLSEVGLAGFIPWLAFFLLFLVLTIRAWFRRRNTFSVFIGAGGLAATVALLTHSLADFNLQIPANAMLLFLVMGLTWRVVNSSKEQRA